MTSGNSSTVRVVLRPSTPDDHLFLWELHRATLRDYVKSTWSWNEAEQLRMFNERLDLIQRDIALCDGERAGCLAVRRDDPARLFLDLIEIAPPYQRRGIGTALINELQQEAARQGVPLELHVLRVNPARRLYERLGFVTVEEQPERYVMRWLPPAREVGHVGQPV